MSYVVAHYTLRFEFPNKSDIEITEPGNVESRHVVCSMMSGRQEAPNIASPTQTSTIAALSPHDICAAENLKPAKDPPQKSPQ